MDADLDRALMSAALLWPVDRIVPLRVGAETEGLDLALQDERGYKL